MSLQLLIGHTSADNAHLIFDYPFGRSIRCVQRIWVETAEKGAQKGNQRIVTQTPLKSWCIQYTDRIARDGQEAADNWARAEISQGKVYWNATKPGTYSSQIVLYIDPVEGHVKGAHLHHYHGPDDFVRFRSIVGDGLDEAGRKRYALMEKMSRYYNKESWAKYDAAQQQPAPDEQDWPDGTHGHCDTCGKAADADGCTADRTHQVAIG